MTKEQIDAARSELRGWCRASMSIPPNRDQQAILKLIDALCEAARQPESLVGRRARFKSGGVVDVVGLGYKLEWEDGFTGYYGRDGFTLEDTDAK